MPARLDPLAVVGRGTYNRPQLRCGRPARASDADFRAGRFPGYGHYGHRQLFRQAATSRGLVNVNG